MCNSQQNLLTQSGFAPIQIILSILAGTIVLGGVISGVLYLSPSEPVKKQPVQKKLKFVPTEHPLGEQEQTANSLLARQNNQSKASAGMGFAATLKEKIKAAQKIAAATNRTISL